MRCSVAVLPGQLGSGWANCTALLLTLDNLPTSIGKSLPLTPAQSWEWGHWPSSCPSQIQRFYGPLLLYLQHSCGHQVLLARLLVIACSHPHYRWPSLGLPSHNLPQPLYRRPGFETPPTPTPCGTSLGWLLLISSRAESEFPVQFFFFLRPHLFALSPPAMCHPRRLLIHNEHLPSSGPLLVLSPCLPCASPTVRDGPPLRSHPCRPAAPCQLR